MFNTLFIYDIITLYIINKKGDNVKKKKIEILIRIFVITVTFTLGNSVNAKECNYYSHADLSPSENINVSVTINNKGKPKAVIKSYYDKYDMTNSEAIQNWSDIESKYSSSNKCPQYIMVTKTLTGYNVYLSYNEAALQKIANDKNLLIGSKKAIVTHCSTDYTPPKDKEENLYKRVEEKTKAIKDAADKFNIEDCKDNSKVITRISECRSQYNSANMILNSAENEIRGLIASGDISADDPRVKAFFAAVEKAKKKWEKAEKQIEKEQKKIDEEMSDDPEKPKKKTETSYWNTEGGETNKFLKKVWGMLKVIVPVLVVILSIADFLKTLIVSDEKNYKEGFIRFLKRIGVAIILFVLPAIIKLLLDLAGMSDVGIFEVFS